MLVAGRAAAGRDAQERTAVEIERPRAPRPPARRSDLGIAPHRGRRPQIDDRQAEVGGGPRSLARGRSSTSWKVGAQRLVAAYASRSRRAARARDLQAPGEPHGRGEVVGGAARRSSCSRNQRRSWAKESGKAPVRGRRQDRWWRAAAAPRACSIVRGEGLERRVLEDGAQRDLHAEQLAHAGDQAGSQQRVTAEIEEIVGAADRRGLEQLRPEAAQQLLNRAIEGGARSGPSVASLRQRGGAGDPPCRSASRAGPAA